MTKRIFILSILFVGLLSACSLFESNSTEEYDFAISEWSNLVLIKEEDGQLKKVSEKKFLNHDVAVDFDQVMDGGEFVYGRTGWNKPHQEYLFKFNKKELRADLKDAGGGTTNVSTYDGEHLYTLSLYTDRMEFYKYDENLAITHSATKAIDIAKRAESSNALITTEDKLYLLVGVLDKTNDDYFNELWILDKDFKVEKQITLGDVSHKSPVYHSMVLVDNVLYITEVLDSERAGGEHILAYHLESGQTEKIPVATPYPFRIRYDKELDVLEVLHDSSSLNRSLVTFINRQTKEQRTITLLEENRTEPFCTKIEDEHYYLFNDILVKYNYTNDVLVRYDLRKLGIEKANAIFE